MVHASFDSITEYQARIEAFWQMSAQDKIGSDIYQKWSDISRKLCYNIKCWLGHVSDQKGIVQVNTLTTQKISDVRLLFYLL